MTTSKTGLYQGAPKAREKNLAHLSIGRGNIISKHANQHSTAHQPVHNGGAVEYVVLNQHSPMKPLAGECRLGKYNFSILLVILL